MSGRRSGTPMLSDRAAFRRRRLSMTSLIDVIFLLLLFFMLSSTFSRYGELPLTGAGAGGAVAGTAPRFLQLRPETLVLNGAEVTLEELPAVLAEEEGRVLVALGEGVTAQRLTDLLVALRRLPGLTVAVLE